MKTTSRLKVEITDVQSLLSALDQIREAVGDDEVAHGMEDHMREQVLALITHGHKDYRTLAAFALTSGDIDFSRWCA